MLFVIGLPADCLTANVVTHRSRSSKIGGG